MNTSQLQNRVRLVAALLATALLLPTLTFADHDNGKWNKGDRDEHRWGDHDTDRDEHAWGDHDTDRGRNNQIPVVPEANAGWVLIPFFGAVLLVSLRQFFRADAK